MASNSSTFPYDTVVMITDTIGSESWQGSGVLIAPDEVLTASHVVYSQGVGTASDIVVTPGFNDGSKPYGSSVGTYIHYETVADANGSIALSQSQDDFAVIHLATPFTSIGSMGIDPNYDGGSANVTGYPASAGGTQVTSAQRVTRDPAFTLLDGTALGEGSSGGPLWIQTANGPEVVGLVSCGSTSSAAGYNVQITSAVANQIRTWLQEGSTGSTATPVPSSVPDAFPGGRTSDILFENLSTGATSYLVPPSTNGQGTSTSLGTAPTAYSIVGIGDFNDDGTSDILYRNNATGANGYFAMPAGGGQGTWTSLGTSSTAYTVVGDSDFNGDGTADLLYRNFISGDAGVFLLNADGTNTWQDIGSPSLMYSVAGVGDFTGNGRSDILFRNNATGDTGYYEVATAGSPATWVGLGMSSTAYSVVGVGDFNGDGTSDILFRNDATGDAGYLAMPSGAGQGQWVDIGTSLTAYKVVAVGNYTGSPVSDILFRNAATGNTGYFVPPTGGGQGSWHGLGTTATVLTIIGSPAFG